MAIGLMLGAQNAQASFKLESTGVILKETEGRTSFNVENTSSEPILLVVKLHDLDNQNVSKYILISPPIVRIDPGQSQQINFVLKKGKTLHSEVLLKASFEGVSQANENSAKMPIRQEVGFLVLAASVAETKTPWDDLTVKMMSDELVISNEGKHVIRLAPQFTLLPSNEVLPLSEYYFMPGATKRFKVKSKPVSIQITPLSRYGFKLPDVGLPVK
jgi:P pilus assembly chaperone PapD